MKELIFELKASGIHGVGVFATEKIAKGTFLPLFEDDDCRFITTTKLKKEFVPLDYIKKHSIEFESGFSAPKNFNRMSVGWYLNHSSLPNAHFDDKYYYYALQNIKRGEEITIDYDGFE